MTTNQTTPVSLGQYLLDKGILTPAQWELVFLEQRATGRRLSQIVSSLGLVSHDKLIAALLDYGSEEFFEEERFTALIPAEVLAATQTMVVAELPTQLHLATLGDVRTVKSVLAQFTGQRTLHFVPCSPERLERYLARLKESSQPQMLLEHLLQKAAHMKVSDIHLVPKEKSYLALFRHLGVRYPEHEGTLQEHAYITSRIKDLARLDLAERRLPQDGSFRFAFEARHIDFRVATVPTMHGEYVVLRLLDPQNAAPSLETLGITRLAQWKSGMSRSDGLCLVCGPTGSGKTTTLNATIKSLDRVGNSVFTVEDPVEGHISLTGQVNVNAALGLDFSRALKAFMRADPDIIVLGEIRDSETARNALRAAETGHLVFATLHTESIEGAAQRMRDLGVPPSEIAPLLRAVLVQRLIRVSCPHCHGAGCPHCNNRGYVGRTVVSECEYFPNAAAVNRMLEGERTWPSLLDDARDKALQGETTAEEVRRIFGVQAEDLFKKSDEGQGA